MAEIQIRIEKVKMASGAEKVMLSSPYHPNLPARAKALGGKFSYEKKAWYFDPRDKERVRALAREIYGSDGSPTADLVTLRVSFPNGRRKTHGGVFVAGRCVARAYNRDSGADLGEGVILLEGKIRSGGSWKNWETIIESGSVFEIRDVPRPAAEAAVAQSDDTVKVEILPPSPAVDVEALKAEKERLLARIAEIDAILSA